MRVSFTISLVPIFALQRALPPHHPSIAGSDDVRQALCERYAEAMLRDGPNSEDPHQQCQQYIRDLSPQGVDDVILGSSEVQGFCESLGAGLVALHLSGGISAGDSKRNAEACRTLTGPQIVNFHALEAPEPSKLKEFGEPLANETQSATTSTTQRTPPKPVKLEEFGKGRQTTTTTTLFTTTAALEGFGKGRQTTTTTTSIATTLAAVTMMPPKRLNITLRKAYEPLHRTVPAPVEADSTSESKKEGPADGGPGVQATSEANNFTGMTKPNQTNETVPPNISSEDACAACAAASHEKSSGMPDISHGPEVRSNAMGDAVDVTTNVGRARNLAKGEVTSDACRRTVKQILKLMNAGVLKKEDLGGNVAPVCERQARGEFQRILLPGDSLNRGDERAIEELCFKLDGRLTMAIEEGQLLPRPTPIGMRAKGTPDSFCEGFAESTYPKNQLKKLPELPDKFEPTLPPTPPPDPLEMAVLWATGLKGFHRACVNFLAEFKANVTDTIQLTLRRYDTPEGGRGRQIKISRAFPWSGDLQGFKTCQEEMSEALNQSRSESTPLAFRDKDWPERICLDLALGYMSVKSAQLEPPKGLVSEAQAFTALGGATPDIFCRTYEAQFGQQAPPGAAGDKGQEPARETSEGGLSGQMSGNENPPEKPRLTRSTSANHAEQKQRGTEKETHWLTGSMPGPNHDINSFLF